MLTLIYSSLNPFRVNDMGRVLSEQIAYYEYEKSAHQNENRDVEGSCAVHKPRERVVSPLNDRNLIEEIKVRQTMFHILDQELKDAESLWRPEFR